MTSLLTRSLFMVLTVLGMGATAQVASAGVLERRIAWTEEKIKQKAPEYRLIRRVETFPERLNATAAIKIDSEQNGAIATLHVLRTGEPLESCATPCTLHGRSSEVYALSLYKHGYMPKMIPIETKKWAMSPRMLDLGSDYNALKVKRLKCKLEFQKNEKVDGDAAPCVRIAGRMPVFAKKSGHCKLTFDINAKGYTKNIKIKSCTNKVFKPASMWAVHWWYYNPKVERGVAVERPGVETKMTFRLTDEQGEPIPE